MTDSIERRAAYPVMRRSAIPVRSSLRPREGVEQSLDRLPSPGHLAPDGSRNTIAGALLVGWSILAAVVVSFRPGSNALDRLVQSLIGFTPHSRPLLDVTKLGTRPVLVAASVMAATVAAQRDRPRAVACLVAPLLAAVTVEWVMKPLVGRHYAGVLTFPSGTVTVTAAIAAAWVLAVPRRFQATVLIGVALATAAVSYAVVALRWHYPTDALVAITFAAGTVLLVDGAAHLFARARRADDSPHS